MKLKILLTLIIFLFVAFPTFAAKPLVIGADLKEFKPLHKKQCNITVPTQYATIQAAVNASVNGNTVCVNAGTYNENVLITKSIVLSGHGTLHQPSIINGQTSGYVGAVRIEADNVLVEGFIIIGIGTDYQNGALRIAESHSGVTIQYNQIKAGNGELAFLTDGFQNNHVIQNNILTGTNSPQVALVNGQPSVSKPSNNIKFLNNTFNGTVNPTSRDDTGIVLTSQATNNIINRNIFNTTGTIHEIIQCSYSSNIINENNLNSSSFSPLTNTPVKVRASGEGLTNAKNNWWGDLNPSDNIQGNIDFADFATIPFKQN